MRPAKFYLNSRIPETGQSFTSLLLHWELLLQALYPNFFHHKVWEQFFREHSIHPKLNVSMSLVWEHLA